MAKLLVHESAGVREFEIVDNEVHMGRELDNTLRLPDPSISRHHCVVRKVAGGYEIQDLQSSNGVLVNGNRVQSSPLRDGDRITLGQVQLT
ncbi:MAG TPA: FHA domain-containing protein, partial [Holophagaceae bacterium]